MEAASIKTQQGMTGAYRIRTYNHDEVLSAISVSLGIPVEKCEGLTPSKEILATLNPLYESPLIENKIVSSSGYGRNIIMRQLGGDTTYPIKIDSAAIGTGTNAPADADTGLQTSVLSGILVTDAVVSPANVLTLSFFITSASLSNGTYTEFGLFCNSRLFARSLISPSFVKGANQDTTVEYVLTLTSTS